MASPATAAAEYQRTLVRPEVLPDAVATEPERPRSPVVIACNSPESESCFSVMSSVASPMALWNRRAGSLIRQRLTMRARSRGRVVLIWVTGGGLSLGMEERIDTAVSPLTGLSPVLISYRITPRVNTSDCGPTGFPSACSGDM